MSKVSKPFRLVHRYIQDCEWYIETNDFGRAGHSLYYAIKSLPRTYIGKIGKTRQLFAERIVDLFFRIIPEIYNKETLNKLDEALQNVKTNQ